MKADIDDIQYVMNIANEKEFMMRFITYCISPTIAGYKPVSIITISNNYKQMYTLWQNYGDEYMENISLKIFNLQHTQEKIVIIFYNEDMLKETIFKASNKEFLYKFGYSSDMSVESHLMHLKSRFFFHVCPHEMGIFLGIPLGDVEGFIECSGDKYIYCGYWKIYENVEKAIGIFDSYNRCKCNLVNLLKNDTPLPNAIDILERKCYK
ncbi:DUF3793 family protein [Clostridium sp. 19966]|uniref:DUF3793 family protein n=1 Tax=Clostridium sp. 19966 TaxID=2768166 RepID=UPI0028E71EF8|nr:DUF3793 family protein [Clostridium sp. 19966]